MSLISAEGLATIVSCLHAINYQNQEIWEDLEDAARALSVSGDIDSIAQIFIIFANRRAGSL